MTAFFIIGGLVLFGTIVYFIDPPSKSKDNSVWYSGDGGGFDGGCDGGGDC